MLLEEFLVALKAETDTEKVKSFSASLAKVATVGVAVVGVLKTMSLAAWAFADSYVRRAEELYKSNDGLVKITKEQVEMSKKYQEGMGKLGKEIEAVKIKVAFGFLPTMLNMVNTFNDFLAANKDLIANGITKLLEAISLYSQVINNTVRFFTKAIEATIGWEGALMVLAAAFLWVKRAMILAFVTNPIAWVIAAIAALLLLIDDFMTYLDGGESQFGEFWGSLIDWIKDAKQWWSDFVDYAIKSYSDLVNGASSLYDGIVAAVTPIYSFFVSIFESISKIIGGFVDVWAGIFNFIAAAWAGDVEGARDAIAQILGGFDSMFEGVTQYYATLWEAASTIVVGIFNGMSAAFQAYVDGVSKLISKIPSFFEAAFNYIKSQLVAFFSFGLGSAKSFVTGIGNVFKVITELLTAPFAKAFDWISDKFSGLGGMIGGAISGLGRMVGLGNSVAASNTSSTSNLTINAPVTVTSNNADRAAKLTASNINNLANSSAYRNMTTKVIA